MSDATVTDANRMDAGGDSPAITDGAACTAPMSLLCNGTCVDPTGPAHCGSCTNDCTTKAPAHGSGTCGAGTDGGAPACGFACDATYHACNGACASDGDGPASDPCILSEAFGVFVSPGGDDTHSGTQGAPVRTLGHAMDLAKAANKSVFACGSAGSYTSENVVVNSARDGVRVYGGLDCTTAPSAWKYDAAKPAVVAPAAAGYALAVSGLTTGVTFEDFSFVAKAGANPGDSSIAVFAEGSTGVVLRRCSATAGAGVAGLDGAQPAPYGASAPAGHGGDASRSAGGTGNGGAQQANPMCTTSIGGAGGSASSTPPTAVDGQSGQVGPNNAGTSADCSLLPAQGGGPGAPGGVGSSGPGASSWASLAATGWTPNSGTPGTPGTNGQGGGGGGVQGALNGIGGGGGGGAGGCGGAGGPGGGGGGSSLAVVLFNATVDFENCALMSAAAGRGGSGALGQLGQGGGGGGAGNGSASCNGGVGGQGGAGGPGGGGAGGVSAGVLWTGTAPVINGASTPSATTLSGVMVGSAGAAGVGASSTNNGKAGTAAAVVQFQ